MATSIKPFRAYVYNPEKITDLSAVVSPPYDIISPELQKQLHEISPYNFTHVDFLRETPGIDKYEKSAENFRRWVSEKILVRDDLPAIYFYTQEYTIRGEKKRRWGFLALLKLDPDRCSVFGHEHTRLAPKEDRMRLIRNVRANLSPIFVIFEDKKRVIEQNLKPAVSGKTPFINVIDRDKVSHTLWRVDDPGILEKVCQRVAGEDIFIADGHHRYEVSCAYRDEIKSLKGEWTGEEPENYLLAYFTNIQGQGLTVLPIHRIIRFPKPPEWERMLEGLKEFFSVEDVKDRDKFLFLLQKAGQREHAIGMYAAGKCRLLRLRNMKFVDPFMPGKSAAYRQLDVAILNTMVLKNALGLSPEGDNSAIEYTADPDKALAAADLETNTCAFLLNPTKVEQIVDVALKGEKMPPKSTYFYPKVLSGLTVNPHEQ